MLTRYNEYLEPHYYLTTEESKKLQENGFVVLEEDDMLITIDVFNEVKVYKLHEEYEAITLYSRVADEDYEENSHEEK